MSNLNNPFAGLIEVSEAKSSADTNSDESIITNQESSKEIVTINDIIEKVFYFTINSKAADGKLDKQLVYLKELAEAVQPEICINLETLEQALFERLLLTDVKSYVIPKNTKVYKEHVVQDQVFPYLFSSMQNLQTYEQSNIPYVIKTLEIMKDLIFRNAVTALKQPALFEGQYFNTQLVGLLQDVDQQSHRFFVDIINIFASDDDESTKKQLRQSIMPVLLNINIAINKSNLINLPIYILPAIQLFASNSHLAPILMETMELNFGSNGRAYVSSVVGSLLNLSVLSADGSRYDFFDDPMDQTATSMMEKTGRDALSHLSNNLHKIFLSLLKGGPELRQRLLTWIGNCLSANSARGKLWNVQLGGATLSDCVSDGFMLNLGAVLLHLCQPFCTSPEDPKSLKIDPTYGAVTPEESAAKQVHLTCLHNMTCLLPPEEEEEGHPNKRPTAETYNFVTECFFMTQTCIDLGIRVCAEKLSRFGQELGRAQRTLSDLPSNAPQLEPIRLHVKFLMTKFISLRCALLEKDMVWNLSRLEAMTSTWLVQVAIRSDPVTPQATYAPLQYEQVQLPIATTPPSTLRCIPEFVLENIVVLITMSRRAGAGAGGDGTLLPAALTLVLAFMGDPGRAHNPHLRARLAECLEAMLPTHPDDQQPLNSLASFYREQLFKEHPYRLQLVPCLLDVFVSIEIIGQNVQFDLKFNYRRPVYLVIDFLWEIEEHREAFTKLAREAEANMEAVRPPIFLRFVNLLMNDAIFLLDEALEKMAQLRTMQTSVDSGSWARLPAAEREQSAANATRVGMQARYDNIMGRDTIRMLARLSAHAPYVFCHPTLVDRIASMLNYFLMHLVGPNKKNFKVKDMKEFEFDPARTVLDICRMYVELGSNERFCVAVSNDGRSYSPELFTLAEAVLVRIGGGSLIGSLQEVATRVSKRAEQRQRDEELLAHAPDEFLDPIMSTLMLDPVLLPSSRTTLDRTTIARHLLSDQSDPFNRSPLSMDQVKSNTELKEKIHAWVNEQRQKFAQNSSENEM